MGERIASAIDRVTVFPGAAWVARVARATATARTELTLTGLPPALDDDTVQVAVRGPARAADVRVTVEVVGADDPGRSDDAELHERRRAAAGAQAELAHLRRQLDGVATLGALARGEREEATPTWSDAVAARLVLVELRHGREQALRAAVAAAERTLEEARRALAAAELRQRQASSAQLPPGAVRKALTITVEPEGAGGEVEVTASYLVPGARWAPSYVARLGDDGELRLEVRASIAQATGEDWTGVAVEVSTAAPQRWIELPELPALRIGRAQPAPARAGWRPAPPGVDGLFADWDRAFRGRRGLAPPPPPPPEPAPDLTASLSFDQPTGSFALEESEAFAAPAPQAPPRPAARGVPLPPPSAPSVMPVAAMPSPAMAPAARKSGGLLAGLGGLVSGGGGGPSRGAMAKDQMASTPGAAAPAQPVDELELGVELAVQIDLLAYARLRMRGPREDGRGKLAPLGRAEAWRADPRAAQAVGQAAERARAAATLSPPAGFAVAAPGAYDYAFAAEARLDVPADGTWHNVALLSRPARVAVRHVTVPAVAPEVYRVASFVNPLDAPLLAGPVDVYDRGELVVTGALDETAPGGSVELGLGVDATVKAARNARFREEAAGMLRGALKLVHEVTITVENLGPRPVELEIRERLPQPAPGEEDVEVHLDRVAPSWEAWRPESGHGQAPLRGGHRWVVEVPAAGRRDLQLDYHVRIAGKHELVGGNRREP